MRQVGNDVRHGRGAGWNEVSDRPSSFDNIPPNATDDYAMTRLRHTMPFGLDDVVGRLWIKQRRRGPR